MVKRLKGVLDQNYIIVIKNKCFLQDVICLDDIELNAERYTTNH